MFSEATIAAVRALVSSDSGASDDERLSVVMAVEGKSDCPREDEKVLSFAEAARILGRRNAQFARNLLKKGKLRGVNGTTGNRPIGVSSRSVYAYIAGN